MGILDKLVSGSVAEPIEAIGKIVDTLYTSKDEKLTHEEMRMRIAQQPHLIQSEINKIEAGHRSLFVAGWRPAVGWVCAIGMAFPFLINPLLQWYTGQPGPELPLDALTEMVFALLGLGLLRTSEKITGRAK